TKFMQQRSTESTKSFKYVARDIAKRYVATIPVFSKRGIKALDSMLEDSESSLKQNDLKKLQQQVSKLATDSKFGDRLVGSLRNRSPRKTPEDVAEAALRILIHREKNKTPQLSFLEDTEEINEPVSNEKATKSALVDGARIQLLDEFSKPYFYGIEK